MKLKASDPEADFMIIAFEGFLVGFVLEADDEEGYIIQADWSNAVHGTHEEPFRRVRRNGRVAFLGNTETDTRETITANLNKHRAACGLGPYEENA